MNRPQTDTQNRVASELPQISAVARHAASLLCGIEACVGASGGLEWAFAGRLSDLVSLNRTGPESGVGARIAEKLAARGLESLQDLWLQLVEQTARHDVSWSWTRGHAGHPQNEEVDRLALQARRNG